MRLYSYLHDVRVTADCSAVEERHMNSFGIPIFHHNALKDEKETYIIEVCINPNALIEI